MEMEMKTESKIFIVSFSKEENTRLEGKTKVQ